MSLKRTVARKVVTVSLCAIVGFAGLAMGQAPQASAAKATKADSIIKLGKKYLGVKYRFGAPSGATSSFDCSSFTQYIYGKYGVKLPRVSSSQATKGRKITKANLKRGDLVFFKSPKRTGNKIGHVAVYLGNNKILHSYPSRGVAYSSLTGYWKTNYVTARRVL
ncbi:NlpC/P60 family protein [Cohnella pontilimi]|uniref:NlpC/P60 family protein n=1 Tax=Cohnella pontilimi TaxID=2564100 RepID=A0A4U0FH26_9BACL|nr:C40 family peptidase [Cohnella pontilimi]TJY44218.1 NlpC/P60 family protein [Cohnella pontilimi]